MVRLFDAEREERRISRGAREDSPFAWLAPWPSPKTKGEIFESVVHRWCEEMGFTVTRTGDSDADRVIEGKRCEIKGSTLWKDGRYRFQQVRDQNYDSMVCLGVSPFGAHCWVIPKSAILAARKSGDIRPQHGGQAGRDTGWFAVNPSAPPKWLTDWGGPLSEGKRVLRNFVSARGS